MKICLHSIKIFIKSIFHMILFIQYRSGIGHAAKFNMEVRI